MGLKKAVFLFLLFTLVFILLGGTIKHGFNSDDYNVIYHALHQESVGWREGLSEFLRPSWGLYYRPGIKVFFELLGRVFHLWSGGYHMMSLICFAVLCFEVYVLGLRITGRWLLGLVSAVIFLTSSVHAEAIFWISSINGAVENILTLASLICFIRWRQDRSTPSYACSLVLFACALLTKESAISLPIIVFIYDMLLGASNPVRDGAIAGGNTQVIREHRGHPCQSESPGPTTADVYSRLLNAIMRSATSCLPFIALGVLFVAVRHVVMRQVHLPPALTAFDWRILIVGLWYSLIMTLSPIDWALALNWFDRLAGNGVVFPVVGGVTILAVVVVPLILKRFRATFLLWWIMVSAAPVLCLGLVPSERHMVLGSSAAAILISVALFGLSESAAPRSRRYSIVLGCVLAIAFAGTSCYYLKQRQTIWKHASDIAGDVVEQTTQIYPAPGSGTTFFFLNVPDSVEGALVFRFDNLKYALRLFYGDESLDAVRIVTVEMIPYGALSYGKSAYFKIGALGGHIYFPERSLQDQVCAERWRRVKQLGIVGKDSRYQRDWERYVGSPFLVYEGGEVSPRRPEALKEALENLYSLH
ncbi:hypothetical protein HZA56_18000 [Candidatus Poribacteria bacterium]|nr:hypothetical protein [Candidatus Poribacteria bacterium]